MDNLKRGLLDAIYSGELYSPEYVPISSAFSRNSDCEYNLLQKYKAMGIPITVNKAKK